MTLLYARRRERATLLELEVGKRKFADTRLRRAQAIDSSDFHRVEELPSFLRRLQSENPTRNKPKLLLRPDWRTTGRSSFLTLFFVLFVTALSLEWSLRRRWGMV